jgi:DNA repair photolyase
MKPRMITKSLTQRRRDANLINDYWTRPATIERNNFVHKSLSCWSYNIAVGCNHACRFCYVPDASTIRLGAKLKTLGVDDPDEQWGDYVFVRKWDGNAFVQSLKRAEETPIAELNADGNRAVMMCTTTDPYQVLAGTSKAKLLNCELETLMNAALHLILERSSLNVRILTRSPLARSHFDIYRKFGKRLLFGMSLPTLNNQLAKIYEPKAPAPSKRLETLKAAKAAGLNVYVAVAPTYPECNERDMEKTLRAVAELDPVTVFMEPINIRADNVKRIEAHAAALGVTVRTGVFSTPEKWRNYSLLQMHTFENLASKVGLRDRLHLWPDASMGSRLAVTQFLDPKNWGGIVAPETYEQWVHRHWNKISAWPK